MALTKSMEKVLDGVFGYTGSIRPSGPYCIHEDDHRQLKAALELQELCVVAVAKPERAAYGYYEVSPINRYQRAWVLNKSALDR